MEGIQNVLLVAYLLIVLALIAVILLQRSEGGGLGMGGNAGGLMTVRGQANLLTRTTAVLAALFFATAIALTILSSLNRGTSNILDTAESGASAPSNVLDALSQMQNAGLPSTAPASSAAPAPAAASAAPAAASASASTDPGLALPQTTPAPSETAPPSSSAAASASSAPSSP